MKARHCFTTLKLEHAVRDTHKPESIVCKKAKKGVGKAQTASFQGCQQHGQRAKHGGRHAGPMGVRFWQGQESLMQKGPPGRLQTPGVQTAR